ncbi:hypothetical protein [Bifidobacterium magnum]|uniref:Uncharacterized protein n=1 Tax=Bifidobacterium magnum TaxID=1692 RepID=A0A087B9P5_9BIFI|nr:hypothetical protein [Bifidobacterium magnum]KFI67745.1 hypothetical protein BMAGN_1555 [Bifidobacterium magnum]
MRIRAAVVMVISSFIAGFGLSFACTHTNLPVGAQCAQWQITVAAIVAIIAGLAFACSVLTLVHEEPEES